MEIYSLMFLLQFIVVIGILGYKLLNQLMTWLHEKPLYDIKGSLILFMAYHLAWVIGLIVFLDDPTELLYSTLMMLENWGLILNILFFAIELLYEMNLKVQGRLRKAYNPKKFI